MQEVLVSTSELSIDLHPVPPDLPNPAEGPHVHRRISLDEHHIRPETGTYPSAIVQLERALARAEEARADGGDTDEVLADVSEARLRHQAVLADVYERVPEQARPGIERAMQASMQGHAEAMRGVSGQRRGDVMRDVEERRREVNPRLEELRARGVPVPAMPSREEIERGPSDRPETGRPDAPGRRGPPERGGEDTTVDSSGVPGADADL